MLTASARLANLAECYWEFECEEFPFNAFVAGMKTDAVRIFRTAAADHDRRDARAADFLAELGGIAVEDLTAQEQATHALMLRELEGLREQYRVKAHMRPWLLPAGPDFNTVFFANSTALETQADAALYVERLKAFPDYLADVSANLLAGHAEGTRFPRAVLEAASNNTRGMANLAVDQSPWFGPFKRSVSGFSTDQDRAIAVIETALKPALIAFADLLAGPLMEGARESVSCAEMPGGRDFYEVFVKHFTTTDMSPEEVHELGRSEVARIEAEMQSIAEQAGYAGNLPAYRRFLNQDPQFVAKSRDDLLCKLESLCKRVDKRIPAFFARIPRITYGVDIIPEAMSAALPPAYAQPAPANGSAPGIFWASGNLSKCPSWMHVPLVVHEAWPGHLMHLAILQELDELPEFRRNGAVKYTAYIEGWALYCETLGVEMDLYQTPHDHYGRLEGEMWRACRLVVDTGIHWFRWSREEAIAYMRERLALDDVTIASEVDRYAAMPAQALGYQIGNLHIRKLRQRAEAELGPRFAPRAFHKAVMTTGAVTLPVLDHLVGDWLAREQAGSNG